MVTAIQFYWCCCSCWYHNSKCLSNFFFLRCQKSRPSESVTSFLLKCFAISECVFHMFSSLKGEGEYKGVSSLFPVNAYPIVHKTKPNLQDTISSKSPKVTNCSDCTHTLDGEREKQRMRFAERVKQNNANDWSKPKKHKWDDTNTKVKKRRGSTRWG